MTWPRCVLPPEARDPLNISLIAWSDGAVGAAGAGVWARVELKDGTHHVQLVIGKSELSKQTVPRNELLGTALGVNRLTRVKGLSGFNAIALVTDSEVTVYWLMDKKQVHKRYVFNRVQHVTTFLPEEAVIRHVKGEENPADPVTKRGQEVEDCIVGSPWFSGYPWMKLPDDQLLAHLTSFEEMQLKSGAAEREQAIREEVYKEITPEGGKKRTVT